MRMYGRVGVDPSLSPFDDSTDASGAFEYLDRYCSSVTGSGLDSSTSSGRLPPLSNSPLGNCPDVPATTPGCWVPLAPPTEELAAEPPRSVTTDGTIVRLWRYATESIGRLMENILEPAKPDGGSTDPSRNGPIFEVVHVNEPFSQGVANTALSRSFVPDGNYFTFQEDDEEDELDVEDVIVQIDLSSALRAYRKNPNECFGHLVAAALSGRSAENPVTAEELKEARRNPYLVRMLLESERLNLDDYDVQQELQCCVDSLVSTEVHRVPPAVFQHLLSLFKPHFIRLNAEQYGIIEDSGFEFVQLLYEYPHLFTGSKHFLRMNNGCCGWYLAVFVMVLNAILETLCNAGIALVSVHWLNSFSGNHNGLYSAIVYGAGYASHLIAMIFLMRGRERERVFGSTIFPFPSPHLHVLPVVPLYNIVSIVTYVRYRLVNEGGSYVDTIHDIMASQVLSSVCFSFCVAVPQLMCQMYLISTRELEPKFSNSYPFRVLSSAVCATYLLSLMRLFWIFTTQTSINNFGFACYSFHSKRIIQRYSALLWMVYAASLFLLELNLLKLVMAVKYINLCQDYVRVVLSALSIVTFVAMLAFLVLRCDTVFRVAWTLLPITGLQIGLIAHKGKSDIPECSKIQGKQEFGYRFQVLVWFVPMFFLVLWVLQIFFVFVVKKRLHSFC